MIGQRHQRRQLKLSLDLLLFETKSLPGRQRRCPKRVSEVKRLFLAFLVLSLLAADGSAEVGDIGGVAGHHVETLLGVHGVTMKRNSGAEIGGNRPVVAEEL